jgi:sec-independent protein translocase protein TatB
VFNLQGSELIIILLLALVVLGPEKLPDAMRKLGEFYGQLKKMSSGFQQEFRAATQEPMREIRDTANTLRDSVDFRKLSTGEREEKPKSAEMAPAQPTSTPTPTPSVPTVAPADPADVPTSDVPFVHDEGSDAGADVPQAPVDIAPEAPPSSEQNEGP